MPKDKLLSPLDFLKFSRTHRATLYHYDELGLLPPAMRKATGYRYYSQGQIALLNAIRIFQDLGMPLGEIKKRIDKRTPARANEMLGRQIAKIDAEIERWNRSKNLLFTLRRSINAARGIDERKITVQFFPGEKIALGDPNDYSAGDDYDALPAFYDSISRKYPGIDLNYPAWGVFSRERIAERDWKWPDRYYFPNPEGNDEKSAGLYVVGHIRCGYGGGSRLYERLLDYIDKNNYEICGNAYEDYLLNEFCISDEENYLMRLMINVRGKK